MDTPGRGTGSPHDCLEAINLHHLAFSAEQLRDLRELIVLAVLEAPDMTALYTLVTGIKNDREIGLIPGSFGLVGLAAQGCNPEPQCFQIEAVPKLWHPRYLEIIIDQCVTDVYDSLVRYALNCGIDVYNLTTTDYFAFILDILVKDIKKMIFRMAWFGDEAATNEPFGELTPGVNPGYFNVFDGFFVQLALAVTANPARRTAIHHNTGNYQHQTAYYGPHEAYDDVNNVIDDAPPELQAQPDQILLVTRSVHQKILRHLQALGVAYNISLMTGGLTSSVWDGIPMYSLPLWDEMIRAYFNDTLAGRYDNPNRVLYTTKSNLNIGMACTSLFENVNVFYDQTTRLNRIEAVDAFDVKLLNDNLFQIGI
jgi:hypothetical protein